LKPEAEADALGQPTAPSGPPPTVCDYEGSTYEADFWVGQNRDYEDRVERIALRRLLPPTGHTLIDIGAGFGRLADLYGGYERVILVDYSRSLLRQAQARLGKHNPKYVYVAANVYHLPFVEAVADALVMVRVIHHLTDVPTALAELARILRSQGRFVLEFANKRNTKAILRYLLRRQKWNPFDPEPVEFVALNYNYHPRWIETQVQGAKLNIEARLSVSHLRIPLLKKAVPLSVLAHIDSALQWTGRWAMLSPSGFLLLRQTAQRPANAEHLFQCPVCGGSRWPLGEDYMPCQSCGNRWTVTDGLYDFKQPLQVTAGDAEAGLTN